MTPFKNAKGTNSTYGAAGDRDGNGWWAQMAFDTIGKADMTSGKTTRDHAAGAQGRDGTPAGSEARLL